MKLNKNNVALSAAAAAKILTGGECDAQLPFYSGFTPGPYAIEGRHYADADGVSAVYVTKAFPEIKKTKFFGYMGTSSRGDGMFWGVGPRMDYADGENFTMKGSVTVEGNGSNLSGITSYNTLKYKNMFMDMHPGMHVNSKDRLSPDFHINLGTEIDIKRLGKIDVGVSGGMDSDFKSRDIYARVSRCRNGNFLDFGVGYSPLNKTPVVRFAVQQVFGDSRTRRAKRR